MARAPSNFERQVLPHLDAAYNLARWLVRDPATAEDVVQDAMLRALRFQSNLRGDAKPWLLQIVRNAAYAQLATGRRTAELPLDAGQAGPEIQEPGDDPEAALARQQNIDYIDVKLDTLPAELRECLVLRELEELSYKEISSITGVPIGTVMSRLWRARRAMQDEL